MWAVLQAAQDGVRYILSSEYVACGCPDNPAFIDFGIELPNNESLRDYNGALLFYPDNVPVLPGWYPVLVPGLHGETVYIFPNFYWVANA